MSDREVFNYQAWAQELRKALTTRENVYQLLASIAPDEELPFIDGLPGTALDAARLEAVRALADLLGSILHLPNFKNDPDGSGLRPLRDLANAMAGLHSGRAGPLLATRKIPAAERPTEHDGDFRKGQRQAAACYIVELLGQAGLAKPAQEAAKMLGRKGFLARKRINGLQPAISHKTLEKWAAEIAGEAPEGRRRKFLDDLRRVASGLAGQEAHQMAEYLAEKFSTF